MDIFKQVTGDKSLLYILGAIALFKVTSALGTGSSIAELGRGIQTGVSAATSPTISPNVNPKFSFVPEIGLKFNFPWDNKDTIEPSGYQNNGNQYTVNEEARNPTVFLVGNSPGPQATRYV